MSTKELKIFSDQSNLNINNIVVAGSSNFSDLNANTISSGAINSNGYTITHDLITQRNYFKPASSSTPYLVVSAPGTLPGTIFNYSAIILNSSVPESLVFPTSSTLLSSLPNISVGYSINILLINVSSNTITIARSADSSVTCIYNPTSFLSIPSNTSKIVTLIYRNSSTNPKFEFV
jgi:hypothetical protein